MKRKLYGASISGGTLRHQQREQKISDRLQSLANAPLSLTDYHAAVVFASKLVKCKALVHYGVSAEYAESYVAILNVLLKLAHTMERQIQIEEE